MENPSEELDRIKALTTALSEWQQGDCVVQEQWFAYRISKEFPLADAAKEAAAEDFDLAESRVAGYAVTSQTCDIVRDFLQRPYVEVCPLVSIDDDNALTNIKRGKTPKYAFIPGLEAMRLVADLDRAQTIEKPLLAGWKRVAGCRNSEESRVLAWSLARKRSRFAFPNDYCQMVDGLKRRFSEKHGKSSPEGNALRALLEVRVCATPDWNGTSVGLFYWLIRDEGILEIDGKSWDKHLESWEPLLKATGRFHNIGSIVATYQDMTAHDYRTSDSLDLDNLSMAASA